MIKRVIVLLAICMVIFNEQIVCRNLLQTIQRNVRQAEQDEAPEPYSFNYESVDENGTISQRQEQGDAQGNIVGQYSYQNPQTGLYRIVSYTSDANGFSARVETNEPGTKTSNPANVEIISSAQ